MNRLILRMFTRLLDSITEHCESFRYEDPENKAFWSEVGREIQTVKRKILDKFDM